MAADSECQLDFEECVSGQKIKSILNQTQLIFNDNYSNLNLLNDFNHIKYSHNINQDPYEFNLFFIFLTENNDNFTKCDINTCTNIQRYYQNRRRDQFVNKTAVNVDDFNYSNHLLSRIHVYFLHSLETTILTLD
eukprot:510739_1